MSEPLSFEMEGYANGKLLAWADELQREVMALRVQLAELQAWKDAVPVTAILTMRFGNILDGFTVDNALDDVESWLMDIAEQPEVQP